MGRPGKVTFGGAPITLIGPGIKVGSKAPDFAVLDKDLKQVRLGDFSGKIKLISVTPSLDTSLCDLQLRRFNHEIEMLGDEFVVINISMDLPFAISRFCTAAGIDNKVITLSDHRDASFGKAYGVLIKELRLLSRAVFVVGKDDIVKYAELVPEVKNAVDYDKILAFVKDLK